VRPKPNKANLLGATSEIPSDVLHRQYLRQASWTRQLRSQLYRRINLLRASAVLDVGCGTGAVTTELASRTQGQVTGVDIDDRVLAFARQENGDIDYRLASATSLPFPQQSFDVVTCHFLLLWLSEPFAAMSEMRRVLRPGGALLVAAEPDYGGRIDYPPALDLRQHQMAALRAEGANPLVGRELRSLFQVAGMVAEVGLVPGVWDLDQYRAEFAGEWETAERSLLGVLTADQIAELRAKDWRSVESGERFVFLPIFYALYRMPSSILDGG
jgi:SAM-dependent methyltransferase